jgi:hypothetical protein
MYTHVSKYKNNKVKVEKKEQNSPLQKKKISELEDIAMQTLKTDAQVKK